MDIETVQGRSASAFSQLVKHKASQFIAIDRGVTDSSSKVLTVAVVQRPD